MKKGIKTVSGKSTGVKRKKKSKRAKDTKSRGLRQEPSKPWGTSVEPGVPGGPRAGTTGVWAWLAGLPP